MCYRSWFANGSQTHTQLHEVQLNLWFLNVYLYYTRYIATNPKQRCLHIRLFGNFPFLGDDSIPPPTAGFCDPIVLESRPLSVAASAAETLYYARGSRKCFDS